MIAYSIPKQRDSGAMGGKLTAGSFPILSGSLDVSDSVEGNGPSCVQTAQSLPSVISACVSSI